MGVAEAKTPDIAIVPRVSIAGKPMSANKYQTNPTRHCTIRRSSRTTPSRPSMMAVTSNALTLGPEKVPIPIVTRKLDGLWNGSSPLPSRERTNSAHTSHVPAYAMTK
jgi:hypothetical protein